MSRLLGDLGVAAIPAARVVRIMSRPRFAGRLAAVRSDDFRQRSLPLVASLVRACRVCGCTDNDCRQCIERTGAPCRWVAADLCSACEERRAA